MPSRSALFATALAPLLACGSSSVIVHELAPGGRIASRAPESVEVYRNAPPSRAFESRYLIDLSPARLPEPEAIAKYRDVGARLGCDAVVVYTADHPAIKAGPRSDDEALVIDSRGGLSSRAIGATTSNRRALFVTTAGAGTIVVDAPTAALCIAFAREGA